MTLNKTIIWSISGADCSGGAGIAADIKTAQMLGAELCHLITANTVQNSQQLLSVNPVDAAILAQQAQALIDDKPPQVVKVGLVVNEQQLQWLITLIFTLKRNNPLLQVIFDPVGQASVGGKMSSLTRQQLLPLLAQVEVLTPNLMEAQLLASESSQDIALLTKALLATGVKQLIIKGGHLADDSTDGYCTDYAYCGIGKLSYQLSSARIASDYSHGGGCSFATALGCFLGQGYLLRDAFTLAKAFIQQGLSYQQGKLGYYGAFEQGPWPTDKQYFPKVSGDIVNKYRDLPAFKDLGITRDGSQSLGVYPVVDSIEWLARLMPLGINIIQLRLKNKSQSELASQIQQAVILSKQHNCRLFINDHWQLAIEYGAYGVHIGQEDLLGADLDAIAKAGLRLGISTHGCYEFLLAQQLKPSYLAIGAIFPTKTKDMTGQIQGLENLKHLLGLATDIPVVAIGGINLQRAPQVWQTGVDSLAVVTAITCAENPEQAAKDFQQICLVNG